MASLSGILGFLKDFVTPVGSLAQQGKEALLGAPAKTDRIQRFTPGQQQLQSQILESLSSQLSQPAFNFEPIEKLSRERFRTETIPSLAQRVSSMGEGALSSPAYRRLLGEAATGLESQLAGLRAQTGLEQQKLGTQRLATLLSGGLTPQFDTIYSPATQGQIGNLTRLLPLLFL